MLPEERRPFNYIQIIILISFLFSLRYCSFPWSFHIVQTFTLLWEHSIYFSSVLHFLFYWTAFTVALYPRTKKSLKCPAKALSRIQNEPILFTESFQIIELFLQLRVLHASSMKLYFQFVFELNVECACSLTLWSLWQENYSNQHQRSVGVTKNGNLVIKKKNLWSAFTLYWPFEIGLGCVCFSPSYEI